MTPEAARHGCCPPPAGSADGLGSAEVADGDGLVLLGEGDGDAVVGDGDGDDVVGDGDGVGEGLVVGTGRPGSGSTSVPSSAAFMKAVQIWVG